MRSTFRLVGVPLIGGVLCLLLGQVLGSYWTGILTQVLILGIFASSLDVLLGYTGLPSLGHAAYFGISAYSTGIATVRGAPVWLAITLGLAAGTALAAAFGPLALRTSKAYFLMITLALAQIVHAVVFSFDRLTGGDNGLVGIGRPAAGADGMLLSTADGFLALVVVVAVVYAVVGGQFLRSPLGAALRAVRDNEVRMEALGYSVWRVKYVGFVASGFGAAVAGVLFAYYNRFVSPEILGVPLSAEALLMVILGGAGTFLGAFAGSAIIVVARNSISGVSEHWLLALGVIYILTVLFAPSGVVGAARDLLARLRSGRTPAGDADVAREPDVVREQGSLS